MTTAINTTGAAASATTTSTAKNSLSGLGSADFLKLMTEQLKQQDPTKPADNSQMLAQMAQFTSLSQSTEMNNGIAALNTKLTQIADKLDAVLTAQEAAKSASASSITA